MSLLQLEKQEEENSKREVEKILRNCENVSEKIQVDAFSFKHLIEFVLTFSRPRNIAQSSKV